MEIILLERVENLGQMGDVVKVKNGFARNFLLPQKKALRATKGNLEHFETQRKEIEARNLEKRKEAEAVAGKMDGAACTLIRQAGDSGQLYGSVSARDVMAALQEAGYSVERGQVRLDRPIKTLGIHDVRVALHPEVYITVSVNVARSDAEAERQASGEDEAAAEAEKFFESEEIARQALEEIEGAEGESAEETDEEEEQA
jgi:large subunit ribosomal protein L9